MGGSPPHSCRGRSQFRFTLQFQTQNRLRLIAELEPVLLNCLESEVGVWNEFSFLIESPKSVDVAVVRHLRHEVVTKFIGKLTKKTFSLGYR
jgi:hypothetical protein